MKITRKQKVMAATGSIYDMQKAFEDKLAELQKSQDIEFSTDIVEECDNVIEGEDDIEECDDVAFV